MIPAYQFGASFLAPAPPNGAGEPVRAIELLKYGIQHNPDNWHLYYDMGFVYYTELKDYKRAAQVFEQGSRVPDAHPFLKLLAAQMAEHASDYETARMLWTATYESSKESNIRQNAIEHLRSIRVDEEVTRLQEAVTRFERRNGRIPATLWNLRPPSTSAAYQWTQMATLTSSPLMVRSRSQNPKIFHSSPKEFPRTTNLRVHLKFHGNS